MPKTSISVRGVATASQLRELHSNKASVDPWVAELAFLFEFDTPAQLRKAVASHSNKPLAGRS